MNGVRVDDWTVQLAIIVGNAMQGKVANLESVVSAHCTILLEHFNMMRASYFDTDLASQMMMNFP